jgi:hypothetical protein
MGKEGRRFLPNLKKLGSPRLNFDEKRKAIRDLQKRFQDIKNSDGTKAISLLVFVIFSLVFAVQSLFWPIGYLLKILIAIDTKKSGGKKSG